MTDLALRSSGASFDIKIRLLWHNLELEDLETMGGRTKEIINSINSFHSSLTSLSVTKVVFSFA